MKSPFILTLLLIASCCLHAQALFTYGNKTVAASEYVRAFNKVYPAPVTDKAKKMREYLDLYINSKLKIQEAAARGYDTVQTFREEFAALRNQVIENYMIDAATMNALVNEAFDRSQKDINVQHIYIPYYLGSNFSDSPVVKLKIQEAYMELQAGKSFEEVALKFSKDPGVAGIILNLSNQIPVIIF
jgi:peptidyl-prolyl cis-trans isomerase SurA